MIWRNYYQTQKVRTNQIIKKIKKKLEKIKKL